MFYNLGKNESEYKIIEPDIIPEIKEQNQSKLKYLKKKGEKLECRPISRFVLKDRIILSLTNKFLTELFDPYFEKSSLAFRSAIKNENGYEVTKHHTAVDRILDYKLQFKERSLFVAECDMKKFYDTVNHKKCFEAFEKLLIRANIDYPDLNLAFPKKIFISYLNSYSFYENINQNCNNDDYWSKQLDNKGKSINGVYPWVDELLNCPIKERVGVPQGGALSGLIANIVLDFADKKLLEIEDLFYIRYCDDMILMHYDKSNCEKAINIYSNAIKEQCLFSHKFNNNYFVPNKNYKSNKEGIRFSKRGRNLYIHLNIVLNHFGIAKAKGLMNGVN